MFPMSNKTLRLSNFAIENALSSIFASHNICIPYFVTAGDNAKQIVNTNSYPFFVIQNTSKLHYKGIHWTAEFVTAPDTGEWFDSLGLDPCYYTDLDLYITNITARNTCQLQSDYSYTCGLYTILFC